MKLVFRWYGKDFDDISLEHIRQIPCVEGVVGTLMDVPAGEVWPIDKIESMVELVKKNGLTMEVIESVNVHEDIKLGTPRRDKYIENYIETIRRLARVGIKVICYNFMPVLDWARSHLFEDLPDGSNTMYFKKDFILNTTPEALAQRYAEECGGVALPGWEPERLASIRETLDQYASITQEQFVQNAKYFLEAVIPEAKKCGIRMAIHPDDPPQPIFGLPRLLNGRAAIEKFLALYPDSANALSFCTGSLGANPENDVVSLATEYARHIAFAHVRNLKHVGGGDFYESAHPTACGSLDMYGILQALHSHGFDGYIRPDHGRMIWGEKGRAGYGLYDRALGVTYIAGIWEALERGALPKSTQ